MAGARLKDVAERAGVSIKTVSNVVRGKVRVAEPTRRRVLSAIDELDYRPNASARHLRTGRSGVIALAVPELVQPYFSELATAVIAAAREHDVSVLIEETGGNPASELRVASGLSDLLIDGVLLSPQGLDQVTLARRERRVPLVLLGERDYEVAADQVLIDNVAAAREATAHLIAGGRRRIAAVGFLSDPLFTFSQQRARGYLDALEAAGLPHEPELTPLVPAFSRTAGQAAMRGLLALREPPDAVFCFSDLLASGAVRAVYDSGRTVPRDIAVIGFDDIEETRFSVPSLSTVAPDKRQLARLAVEALLARTAGDPEAPHRTLHVEHRLVARESTARA
ncbi:LacI family transcriptional regulator [Streptomyces abyssalis]|uniref:LacI family transcriptional regulator n=1 Tax=Streptomyces abyssalis TaxID=933944 RepID=A0A1E7JP92_9ACTN|nr:LacI family DNA-binding transcriptional regulator [Streptomyces abyssalis]OEU86548.1 LacI family transcriptional regulator [Streptomyces abyssalis]OEU90063.1 LacI family transcriptional regulator [Streptomyces abyssalis]OEV29006.1 LacI family transcriptional regulator [Streptomyces nanshensis]